MDDGEAPGAQGSCGCVAHGILRVVVFAEAEAKKRRFHDISFAQDERHVALEPWRVSQLSEGLSERLVLPAMLGKYLIVSDLSILGR